MDKSRRTDFSACTLAKASVLGPLSVRLHDSRCVLWVRSKYCRVWGQSSWVGIRHDESTLQKSLQRHQSSFRLCSSRGRWTIWSHRKTIELESLQLLNQPRLCTTEPYSQRYWRFKLARFSCTHLLLQNSLSLQRARTSLIEPFNESSQLIKAGRKKSQDRIPTVAVLPFWHLLLGLQCVKADTLGFFRLSTEPRYTYRNAYNFLWSGVMLTLLFSGTVVT